MSKDLLFFGDSVDIARYDVLKFPIFDKLTKQQSGFFWTPGEVELSRDYKDYKVMTDGERHIFDTNLSRQIVLDTKQSVAPSLALLPWASQPEIETWIQTWTYFETIHSRSYTHIIQNAMNTDPSTFFDGIMKNPEIVKCSRDIGRYYDDLIEYGRLYQIFGEQYVEGIACEDSPEAGNSPDEFEYSIRLYELKKKFWLCLNAVNALEGIRFYASFACTWAFAEQKKMEGSAKLIKFICRDENIHLASVQHMLKILVKTDEDFAKIALETRDEVIAIYEAVVEQEKDWAVALFVKGSMVGMNADMLIAYVEWIANKRMTAVGLPSKYKGGSNPLPWTQKWIAGSEVQVAPQEVELSSYTLGAIKRDVGADTFKGFKL